MDTLDTAIAKRGELSRLHCEVCERFIHVEKGKISLYPNFDALGSDARVAGYLGHAA